MIKYWDLDSEVKRLVFVSDLHLFSSRCNASEHAELITRSIEDADLCVWGGDLFDFRWSRMRTENASVTRAIDWLDEWYQRFPSKRFMYLDGNHDAHGPFKRSLAEWANRRDRFECGMDCVRIENVVLLHGDVIEGKGNLDAFVDYRGRWENKPVASRVASSVYDMAVAARVHKAAAMAAHRRRATCIRLLRWLHQQPADAIEGVNRIVFGHTHEPYVKMVDGVLLFNPGSALPGHGLQPSVGILDISEHSISGKFAYL